MKKLIFLCLIISVFLIGCQQPGQETVVKEIIEAEALEKAVETSVTQVKEVPKPVLAEPVVEKVVEKVGCDDTRECAANEQCIEGECQTIAELYDTDCENKCNFNSVVVETSDDQTMTLSRGRGSYTAGGGLQWNLVPGPDYCPGDEIIIPIKIKKISYSELLNEQTIIVSPGEKSDRIKHPTIKSVDFTLKVVSVNEEC